MQAKVDGRNFPLLSRFPCVFYNYTNFLVLFTYHSVKRRIFSFVTPTKSYRKKKMFLENWKGVIQSQIRPYIVLLYLNIIL